MVVNTLVRSNNKFCIGQINVTVPDVLLWHHMFLMLQLYSFWQVNSF